MTGGLRSVVLNLSDLCNINCTYCFEAKSTVRLVDHPKFSKLLGEIVDAAAGNPEPPFHVTFYGGEPLMQFDALVGVVTALEDRVGGDLLQFSIATNGVLLKGRIAEYLREHKFRIQVSVDGAPGVTDLLRRDFGGRGTSRRLAHVTDNVQEFPWLKARMTVRPETARSFDESIRYLIGIGFWDSSHPIRFDFDYDTNWSDSSLQDFSEAANRCVEPLVEHYRGGGASVIEPLDRVYANNRVEVTQGHSNYCGAGTSQVYVGSDGTVSPCNRLTPAHADGHGRFALGTMELQPRNLPLVLDVIHADTERRPECGTCVARHFCDQSCPARRFASSGSFERISDAQCLITRVTHQLGRRVKAFALLEGWPTWDTLPRFDR